MVEETRSLEKNHSINFIPSITGQDVEVVAEKVTASLDQVTGTEDLKLFAKERIITEKPKPTFHHQAWSVSGSVGIGIDGKINPSISPRFEQDGVRISAVISPDLFEGLEIIHKWLDKTFNQPKVIPDLTDKINPEQQTTDKTKSEQSISEKEKQAGEYEERIKQLDSELRRDLNSRGNYDYVIQGHEGRKFAFLFAVDALKQKEGMTTQEAFDAVWKVFPNAEQHMPPKLQKVVLPAIAVGIMECMAIPACGAFFIALSATILYELGNAGYKLAKMTEPRLAQILQSYQSGDLEKQYVNSGATNSDSEQKEQSGGDVKDIPKSKQKDQSGATPPAPGFEPGDDPSDFEKKHDNKFKEIIEETNTKRGKFTSSHKVTESEALELGEKWIGKGYKEIGKPGSGVYRSADGLRQFRIDSSSLEGRHNPYYKHFHLEKFDQAGNKISNNHLIIK